MTPSPEIIHRNKRPRKPSNSPYLVRIIHNKLLDGWYIVRGPHQTPLGGRFDTKEAAVAHLNRNK